MSFVRDCNDENEKMEVLEAGSKHFPAAELNCLVRDRVLSAWVTFI